MNNKFIWIGLTTALLTIFMNCGTKVGTNLLPGDLNFDRVLDNNDFATLLSCARDYLQTPCAIADTDADGAISGDEIDSYESKLNKCTPTVPGDTNCDNVVNERDYVFFMACRNLLDVNCQVGAPPGMAAQCTDYAKESCELADFNNDTLVTVAGDLPFIYNDYTPTTNLATKYDLDGTNCVEITDADFALYCAQQVTTFADLVCGEADLNLDGAVGVDDVALVFNRLYDQPTCLN